MIFIFQTISFSQLSHSHSHYKFKMNNLKMIFNQTERVDLPTRFLARFAERRQKRAAVGVVAVDGFAMVAAAHEVVNGTGKFNAQRSRHGDSFDFGLVFRDTTIGRVNCQLLELTPLREQCDSLHELD